MPTAGVILVISVIRTNAAAAAASGVAILCATYITHVVVVYGCFVVAWIVSTYIRYAAVGVVADVGVVVIVDLVGVDCVVLRMFRLHCLLCCYRCVYCC